MQIPLCLNLGMGRRGTHAQQGEEKCTYQSTDDGASLVVEYVAVVGHLSAVGSLNK